MELFWDNYSNHCVKNMWLCCLYNFSVVGQEKNSFGLDQFVGQLVGQFVGQFADQFVGQFMDQFVGQFVGQLVWESAWDFLSAI